MNSNKVLTHVLIWVLVMLLAAPVVVFAQSNEPQETFSRAELDQMLAPIALYPDSLLAQVLIAATYPEQVVEADRWVQQNPDLKGDELNAALDNMNWDLSVKALVPFPQVLAMMDDHLDWTTRLGEAFMDQQAEVMASVQGLRHKAYAQGNLKSTDQQNVTVAGDDIEIEPVEPDVVYVPYYDPSVIYGAWWWPDYPPFAYYPYGEPFITVGLFGWLAAVGVGPYWGWGWGYWNWAGGNCYLNVNRHVNINDRHLHMSRGHMRTASFHSMARTGRIGNMGMARFGHGRTGAWNRPSAASVERGFRHGGTEFSRGGYSHFGGTGHSFGHSFTGPRGFSHFGGAGHSAGHSFTGPRGFSNFGGNRNSVGHSFTGPRGFSNFGGNRNSVGHSFTGPRGFSNFGGGGSSHFGGGTPHFSGGGGGFSHFSGGSPHFAGGGGGFSHFGGGGGHFGGGGGHFGGGRR